MSTRTWNEFKSFWLKSYTEPLLFVQLHFEVLVPKTKLLLYLGDYFGLKKSCLINTKSLRKDQANQKDLVLVI